jgi:transcriptional regulator with XRE-family HTH domain
VQINRFALAEFMDGEGLRLTDLHDKTGISKSFLSELRSGTKTEASAATVRKIADALNVRVRALAANPNDLDDELAA